MSHSALALLLQDWRKTISQMCQAAKEPHLPSRDALEVLARMALCGAATSASAGREPRASNAKRAAQTSSVERVLCSDEHLNALLPDKASATCEISAALRSAVMSFGTKDSRLVPAAYLST